MELYGNNPVACASRKRNFKCVPILQIPMAPVGHCYGVLQSLPKLRRARTGLPHVTTALPHVMNSDQSSPRPSFLVYYA